MYINNKDVISQDVAQTLELNIRKIMKTSQLVGDNKEFEDLGIFSGILLILSWG